MLLDPPKGLAAPGACMNTWKFPSFVDWQPEVPMLSARRIGLALCALAAILVLATSQAGSQDPSPKSTTLRVLVPTPKSRVQINGTEMPGRGDERELVAPALAKDKKLYEVTVSWRTNNYTKFYRTRKVAPKPGETVSVDLRNPDPKNPDHIEIRYVPTPSDVVERMCKLAKVGKDDVVYDLGCGDGRIVITAVADFGAKRGVGVDLDPERIKESIDNAKKRDLGKRVEFRVEDVLKIKDMSTASVVMLYMGDDVNLRLRPILQKTLKPGSRIVSHRFGMGDWEPDKTETFQASDGDDYTILLWTIK
jgi:uncharacterized protein (TIGR03000 family)